MGMFDNLIKIDNKGNIFFNQWYEWVHPCILNHPDWFREILRALMQLLGHCSKCTALSGCYFFADKIPSQPQHDNCDCMKKVISINIVSNHIHAECDIRKFTEYIFKDDETSKGKKELFESLGFDKDDAAYLQLEFCRQAEEQYLHGNYILKSLDECGQRIAIPITIKGITFYSGWMIYPEGKLQNTTPFGGWVK